MLYVRILGSVVSARNRFGAIPMARGDVMMSNAAPTYGGECGVAPVPARYLTGRSVRPETERRCDQSGNHEFV